MLHKLLLVHEENGHDEDAGGVVFRGKGNRNLPWSDRDQEDRRRWDDRDGRRIGEDRDQDQDRDWKDRDWKCQCAKLGVVLKGFLRVFQLLAADWHQTNSYMRTLATRFLRARFRSKSFRLSISYAFP